MASVAEPLTLQQGKLIVLFYCYKISFPMIKHFIIVIWIGLLAKIPLKNLRQINCKKALSSSLLSI